MSRREFEMTEDQRRVLMDAGRPTPVVFLSGGEPMHGTPQGNANEAWQALARVMGFVWDTVAPVAGKSNLFFTAEPVAAERQFLTATFAPGGMAYTYHNDGQPVAKGARILVNGRGGKGTRAVVVEEVGVPQPKFDTKPIIGPAPPEAPAPGKLL